VTNDGMKLNETVCWADSDNTSFTQSSKHQANVLKINVLIARHLLDVCPMFAR